MSNKLWTVSISVWLWFLLRQPPVQAPLVTCDILDLFWELFHCETYGIPCHVPCSSCYCMFYCTLSLFYCGNCISDFTAESTQPFTVYHTADITMNFTANWSPLMRVLLQTLLSCFTVGCTVNFSTDLSWGFTSDLATDQVKLLWTLLLGFVVPILRCCYRSYCRVFTVPFNEYLAAGFILKFSCGLHCRFYCGQKH